MKPGRRLRGAAVEGFAMAAGVDVGAAEAIAVRVSGVSLVGNREFLTPEVCGGTTAAKVAAAGFYKPVAEILRGL
jgi:hypothetical protein